MNPIQKMHRFTTVMLLGTGSILLAAGLMVFLIDPANRFGNNRFGVYYWAEREFKEAAVHRYPHDAVFLANSKLSAVNPERLPEFTWMNFAIGGGSLEDLVGYADTYVHNQQVCVLGLDFWMFHEHFPPPSPLYRPPPFKKWAGQYLFGSHSLAMIWRTLTASASHRSPTILPEGYVNPEIFQEQASRVDGDRTEHWRGWFQHFFLENYVYSTRRMAMLRNLRDEMERRQVALVVFLHPQHEQVLDWLRDPAIATDLARFNQDIRAIFPDVIDLTDGKFSDPARYYSGDFLHYHPSTAVEMFEEAILPAARESLEGPSALQQTKAGQ